MLFNVSHVIKTLTVYVQLSLTELQLVLSTALSLSHVAHAPVADSGTKTDAPLLHCSINDTLISWSPHCQNMSTNLINSLDPMFVPISNPLLQNLLRIPCTHNYYYYHFGTCNNYLCEFFKVQWLHFTGVVDKVLSAHVKILQDSVCQKLLKSVQFWLSY